MQTSVPIVAGPFQARVFDIEAPRELRSAQIVEQPSRRLAGTPSRFQCRSSGRAAIHADMGSCELNSFGEKILGKSQIAAWGCG